MSSIWNAYRDDVDHTYDNFLSGVQNPQWYHKLGSRIAAEIYPISFVSQNTQRIANLIYGEPHEFRDHTGNKIPDNSYERYLNEHATIIPDTRSAGVSSSVGEPAATGLSGTRSAGGRSVFRSASKYYRLPPQKNFVTMSESYIPPPISHVVSQEAKNRFNSTHLSQEEKLGLPHIIYAGQPPKKNSAMTDTTVQIKIPEQKSLPFSSYPPGLGLGKKQRRRRRRNRRKQRNRGSGNGETMSREEMNRRYQNFNNNRGRRRRRGEFPMNQIMGAPAAATSAPYGNQVLFLPTGKPGCVRVVLKFYLGQVSMSATGNTNFIVNSTNNGGQWYFSVANAAYVGANPIQAIARYFDSWFMNGLTIEWATNLNATGNPYNITWCLCAGVDHFERLGLGATSTPTKEQITFMSNSRTFGAWVPTMYIDLPRLNTKLATSDPNGYNNVMNFTQSIAAERQSIAAVMGIRADGITPASTLVLGDLFAHADITLCDMSGQGIGSPNLVKSDRAILQELIREKKQAILTERGLGKPKLVKKLPEESKSRSSSNEPGLRVSKASSISQEYVFDEGTVNDSD
jgi:hypothetical protein